MLGQKRRAEFAAMRDLPLLDTAVIQGRYHGGRGGQSLVCGAAKAAQRVSRQDVDRILWLRDRIARF